MTPGQLQPQNHGDGAIDSYTISHVTNHNPNHDTCPFATIETQHLQP
jgi:hypothetical protein